MACTSYLQQILAEEENRRLLAELDARIASGEVEIRRNANGDLAAFESNGEIINNDLRPMTDVCALAWIADHGSLESRLKIQQAGFSEELLAIHQGS